MPLKCLVFDCDGVILDSVQIKTQAFGFLAEPFGAEARDRLMLYHTLHGGVSRYLKFEWFFREYLHREITPEESAEWGRKFEDYALDAVRRCPLIPGVLDTLEAFKNRLPMYVCSGAPGPEVEAILRERGLSSFFKAIYGSPPSKAEMLATIINEAQVEPEETLMIGDSGTDRDAAEKNGTLFYGTGPDLKGGNFPWSENLAPLKGWISAHV